ncbi:sulfatase [Aureibaculum sp. A20]|uniref:Sulfatase n=1 Tax=Aureibaculum flavum TaxID=2795986 RepID=A0ABS0WRR7_9FLAO|nr:sulfatase [Aureibaculum flavum]MBJ2174670.1 sulfatase [Aureibaculum flavum]
MRHLLIVIFLPLFLLSCNNKQKNNKEQLEKPTRPNIIFIMADDHAEQAISAYGHPISKLAPTPNIDRIAEAGVRFNNNFNTNSICGPSRAVILTGKHSHINGFKMNGDKFDGNQVTLPKLLQKEGYQTAIVGKWHLHGYPQGFDYWNIIEDQGHYYNPDFIHNGDTTRIEGYATDIITDMSLQWLEENSKKEKPFFMMIHHKAPHRNWMPAPRHMNLYDSVSFPMPESYFSKHENQLSAQLQLQTVYKDMYEGHDLKMTLKKGSPELAHNPWTNDFDRMSLEQRAEWDKAYQPKNDAFHDAKLTGKALAAWKYQRYMQEYLATIKSVDEGVGKVLDYLEENKLSENTIVVYTSDQGFYLGEKGFFDKRYMYEESLGMPLLMKYPNGITKGTIVEALTQNLDFAETFLDYAQAEIPADMQGKSLKPLLEGKIQDKYFRDAIYYHYYDFPAFHMVHKQYGVRTKRYKLIHFYDDIDTWELYDLQTDPKENKNQIDNPEFNSIKESLLITLDSLQSVYKVTEKDFNKASKKAIDQNYKTFKRLRGKEPVITY